VTGLLSVSLLLAGWSAGSANAAEDPHPFAVSIEVTFEDLGWVANSSAPIRVEVDQAATIAVTVLEAVPSDPPPTIDDPSTLLEIEHPCGCRGACRSGQLECRHPALFGPVFADYSGSLRKSTGRDRL